MNPIKTFENWLHQQLKISKDKLPMACCLSTIGLDEFPNARFVSLKDVINDNFIVTGQLTSRKGIEINHNNNVALTFWWADTNRQIRIQGIATLLPSVLADKFFYERNRDSQIVSIISNQGEEIFDLQDLMHKYNHLEKLGNEYKLERPECWGGYFIKPTRIEFLEFQTTRFHSRLLYEQKNNSWIIKQLQP